MKNQITKATVITLAILAMSSLSIAQCVPPRDGTGNKYGAGNGKKGPWWMTAKTSNASQKKFLGDVQDLHFALQQANRELYQLQQNGASNDEIAMKSAEIEQLRLQLTALMQKNKTMAKKLGANCNGVCDGTGPKGQGNRKGNGKGNGGNGTCDGSGRIKP